MSSLLSFTPVAGLQQTCQLRLGAPNHPQVVSAVAQASNRRLTAVLSSQQTLSSLQSFRGAVSGRQHGARDRTALTAVAEDSQTATAAQSSGSDTSSTEDAEVPPSEPSSAATDLSAAAGAALREDPEAAATAADTTAAAESSAEAANSDAPSDAAAAPAAESADAATSPTANDAAQLQSGPARISRGGPGRGRGRGGRGGRKFSGSQHLKRPHVPKPGGVIVPEEERWFREGDVIALKVEWANARGARVSTLKDPRIQGYMPIKEGPFPLREEIDSDGFFPPVADGDYNTPCMPQGMIREYQVLKVPADMAYNGKGPLVSARLVDLDLMWSRAEQACQMCLKERETVRVQFLDRNVGGLRTRFLGLRMFMPLAHLLKLNNEYLDDQTLDEKYVKGGPTEVAVTEVDVYHRRLVCSEILGHEFTSQRRLTPGALVTGVVRRVEDFGAFVGIDGTRLSGLLHISNISRNRVSHVEAVLDIGDRITAVLLGAEDNLSRLSLSTAELEENAGDMMVDKEMVFENAEEQVKVYRQLVEEGFDDDGTYIDAPRDDEITASGHF